MPAHKGTVSRGHKKRERTLAQLLRAGVTVLGQKGDALTVSDVVAEAQVSSGTFYNYFTDRQALLDALAAHTLESIAASSPDDASPAERIAAVTAGLLKRAVEDPTWARAILRLTHNMNSFPRAVSECMSQDLESGLDLGQFEFGSDDVTLDLISGFLTASIRRIADGDASHDLVPRVVERSMLALGVTEADANKLAVSVSDLDSQ